MKSIFLTCLVWTAPLSAEVKLSNLFSDHMVRQRDQAVPIWGWAEAGEEITVSFAGQSVTTKAAADGAWTVRLAALKTSEEPQTLTAKGKNEVKVSDVKGNKIIVSFKEVGKGVKPLDVGEIKRFAIAGADKRWH